MAHIDHITYQACVRKAADVLERAECLDPDMTAARAYQAAVWIELAKTVKEFGGVR